MPVKTIPPTSSDLDYREKVAVICELFSEGKSVAKMQEEMVKRFGRAGEINREKPYAMLRDAFKFGWLEYHAPDDLALQQQIQNRFSIARAHVAHTVVAHHVARKTARVLLGLVQECHRNDRERDEVHIGFAAGLSMRQVAQSFADVLCEPAKDLPRRVVFHAMVTGFDPGNPTTDPNTFFTFFLNRPFLQVEPRFVGLHAPAMVHPKSIPELKENEEIRDAYRAVKKLDIIATSGSDWADPHSSLRLCMERSKPSMKSLRDAGTIGDILWRPIGDNGPIVEETDIRALTLVELGGLPAFLRQGKRVLLMLGSCSVCGEPKGRILYTTLRQVPNLVSHIVVDSRSARQLIEILKKEE